MPNFRDKLIRLGVIREGPIRANKNWVYQGDASEREVSMIRVDNDTVFISTIGGAIIALDPSGGTPTEEWRVDYYDGKFIRALDAENGRLYWGKTFDFGTDAVRAVSQSDGSAIWTYDDVTSGGSVVVATADRVFAASSSGEYVVALAEADGSEVWKINPSTDSYQGGGSVGDGRVYIADDTGFVRAYDQSDGSVLWEHESPLTDSEDNAPTIVAARHSDVGRVYYPTSYGEVGVLEAYTGDFLYSHDFHGSDMFVSSVQEQNGFIYSCGDKKVICATDKDPPEELWSHSFHTQAGRGIFSLDVVGRTVYSGGTTGTFDDDDSKPEVVSAETSF